MFDLVIVISLLMALIIVSIILGREIGLDEGYRAGLADGRWDVLKEDE